jgi:protein-S-isoprenylcysteine O-methyltransferase Ste14
MTPGQLVALRADLVANRDPVSVTSTPEPAGTAVHVSLFRVIAETIGGTALIAVSLLVSAGTWRWWRAWAIIAATLLGSAATILRLWNTRSGLLEERFKHAIQKGQPLADRILLLSFLLTWFGLLAFTAADVFRLHLMHKPGPVVSSIGAILVAAGSWLQYRALIDNAFAALVIRHQAERNQTVVDTGVYSVLRHPMYAGGIVSMVGTPLWLESYAGALMAIVPTAIVVLRTLFEEQFLRRELKRYEAYTHKVRYRLIPFLW